MLNSVLWFVVNDDRFSSLSILYQYFIAWENFYIQYRTTSFLYFADIDFLSFYFLGKIFHQVVDRLQNTYCFYNELYENIGIFMNLSLFFIFFSWLQINIFLSRCSQTNLSFWFDASFFRFWPCWVIFCPFPWF